MSRISLITVFAFFVLVTTVSGLVLDSSLNVYVPSSHRNVILKFNNDGTLNQSFDRGVGMSVQSVGIDITTNLLYSAESKTSNNVVSVAVVTTDGQLVSSLPIPAPKYPAIAELGVDSNGNVFMVQTREIVDVFGLSVIKMFPNGTFTMFNGSVWYIPPNATFSGAIKYYKPGGVMVDTDGTVYTTNTGNCTINHFSNDGTELDIIPIPQSGFPGGITRDLNGNFYVTDQSNVFKFSPAGDLLFTYFTTNPPLYQPTHVAVDPAGNVYIEDAVNSRAIKLSPSGVLLTVYSLTAQSTTGWLKSIISAIF